MWPYFIFLLVRGLTSLVLALFGPGFPSAPPFMEWVYVIWLNLCPLQGSCFTVFFFASLLIFVLSKKMQFKIPYREEFNRCKIYRMDRICLELETFEKFDTAVVQTLTINAKRCYHHVITLKSGELNQRCVKRPEKTNIISKEGRLSEVISCWRAKYKTRTDRD